MNTRGKLVSSQSRIQRAHGDDIPRVKFGGVACKCAKLDVAGRHAANTSQKFLCSITDPWTMAIKGVDDANHAIAQDADIHASNIQALISMHPTYRPP